MNFRPNRRSYTGGAAGYRSVSPQAARQRANRPTSAPSPTAAASVQDLSHVEQRLRIVKRSRATDGSRTGAEGAEGIRSPLGRDVSPGSGQPRAMPPCGAYPAYDTSPLPVQEQYELSVFVGECMDAILFPGRNSSN